jgi:hypothetical protein
MKDDIFRRFAGSSAVYAYRSMGPNGLPFLGPLVFDYAEANKGAIEPDRQLLCAHFDCAARAYRNRCADDAARWTRGGEHVWAVVTRGAP